MLMYRNSDQNNSNARSLTYLNPWSCQVVVVYDDDDDDDDYYYYYYYYFIYIYD